MGREVDQGGNHAAVVAGCIRCTAEFRPEWQGDHDGAGRVVDALRTRPQKPVLGRSLHIGPQTVQEIALGAGAELGHRISRLGGVEGTGYPMLPLAADGLVTIPSVRDKKIKFLNF